MKAVFITGTGTGVGKTVVKRCLSKYLKEREFRVATQKWIETGVKGVSRSSGGRGARYVFKTACSPHLAARLEHRKIDKKTIMTSFKSLSGYDFCIVEGIGGALVPFNKKEFVIGIAKELDLPVIVVADNKLGAINHTLLTLEALKNRGLRILGVIFNNLKKEDSRILRDNPRIIKTLSKCRVLGVLSRAKDKRSLQRDFIAIGNEVLRSLKDELA